MSGGRAGIVRRGRRRLQGLLCFLVAVCIAVAAPANATNVLRVGGTSGSLGRLLPQGLFGNFDQLLGGAYKNDPITTIDYPGSIWPVTGLLDPTLGSSVRTGTTRLETTARNTPGPLVIIGTSQGAMVVQRAEADLNADPSVPSDTTFILIADPNLGLGRSLYGIHIPILNYTPAALPETRFNTIVVVNQYDGFADPIKRPWNLLTDLNALLGIVYIHAFAQNTDLSTVPAQNITSTTNSQGGTTTTYYVPTKKLPLTMPLRQLGVPNAIVDRIDARLRPIIDAGYEDSAPPPTRLTPAHPAVGRIERNQSSSVVSAPGGHAPPGAQSSGTPSGRAAQSQADPNANRRHVHSA